MSTHPTTLSNLPNFIIGFISTASLEQKQSLIQLLTDDLKSQSTEDQDIVSLPVDSSSELESELDIVSEPSAEIFTPPTPPTPDEPCSSNKLSDLVEHVPKLQTSNELSSGLFKELSGLKLRSRGNKGRPPKIKTQWLSSDTIPYKYGKVINNPKPIGDFPCISKVMDLVNAHPSTSSNMNSCLINCMSSANSCSNFHADDEDLIDQGSDICTVSFGPTRTLEFIVASNSKGRKAIPPPPEITLPAGNHSLNIMRPGCQQKLLHRVPPGNDPGVRYSLSFRKTVPPENDVRELLHDTATPPPEQEPRTQSKPSKKKVTLFAGDSFFARLDDNKLGKGKEEVYNIAKGGRKILQIQHDIEDFVNNHSELDIKTLFISAGTNDIRNCQQGIHHLKPVLTGLLKTVKQLLPNTKIFIQSLLPIPANGNPKAEFNVISLNNLIYNLCSRLKIFYIDVFRSFLNDHGSRNLTLFPSYDSSKHIWDIHPNKKGMGVLARHYIFLIHSKWFNPLGY